MSPPVLAGAFRGRFGRFRLDLSFALPAEGVTALTGPSGAGKTTLLRLIAGLARAEGRLSFGDAVWQDGRRFVPPHRRAVGYVFQEPSLFPHLSLRANLRFGLDRAGRRPGLAFDEVVSLLNLEALLPRDPATLSGGERQRGAIARALLSRPRLLLMDEPTAALDAAAKAELWPYLERLHRDLRVPILYVSHDPLEVDRLADRVAVLEDGGLAMVDRDAAAAALRARLEQLTPDAVQRLAEWALRAGLG